MTDITNVLYWISTGLLIPVIALLLFGFIKSLLLLGGFFGMFINRLKYAKKQKVQLQNLQSGQKNGIERKENPVVAEKILADFELASESDLSTSKTLARLGPMLGLMGTLIPMGPALVGLAAGDIASMAQNMQVAFSTTVVGLFAGAIGYITQLVKQRWYLEDLNNLEFIYKLLNNK